jgi:hypothetical protein
MNKIILITLAFLAFPAFAESITCTLTFGNQSATSSIDLDSTSDPVQSDFVKDISMVLETKCGFF